MKKILTIILVGVMLLSVCGCSRHDKTFLPGAEDFLNVNTVTGLLNRYQSVSCFEKAMNTLDGTEKTCSWQYHQESSGSVSQVMAGDNITLYYNRLLLTTTDGGKNVSYGVYLNESNQPESLYFERDNLFGQEDGAEIALLDAQTETFRFTSTVTVDENMLDDYPYWEIAAGDKIIGTHTVARDDLRILKSETTLVHDGTETLIGIAAWTYLKPMQLHGMWEKYRNSENRKLITIHYDGGRERRYFFPTGTTPELFTDDGHQLFLDEAGTLPYVSGPLDEALTLYYK